MIEQLPGATRVAVEVMCRRIERKFYQFNRTRVSIIILPASETKAMPESEVENLILAHIYEAFKVNWPQIASPCRKRFIVSARHLYFLLMRKYTAWSTLRIGGKVGVDHTTVVNGVKRMKDLLDVNDSIITPVVESFIEALPAHIKAIR
ncbi:helix-turn-helix domain-containing protein [Chitinophaga sp. YR573]|uniref:helix-turn-helix domain-containing protein n=1 Tax=Chitinophaga sp. YR573 TaxID=1881040 RepID=UPI000B7F290D|nr:helix-turn-helix domain-containing protein [Chitinophaga sp. YR573]